MKNKIPVGMHPDDLMHCDNCGGLVEYHTKVCVLNKTTYVCMVCYYVIEPKKSSQPEGK